MCVKNKNKKQTLLPDKIITVNHIFCGAFFIWGEGGGVLLNAATCVVAQHGFEAAAAALQELWYLHGDQGGPSASETWGLGRCGCLSPALAGRALSLGPVLLTFVGAVGFLNHFPVAFSLKRLHFWEPWRTSLLSEQKIKFFDVMLLH